MKTTRRYTNAEKLRLINECLSSNETMDAFQKRHGMGHSTISKWMAKLSEITQEVTVEMKIATERTQEKSLRETALEAKVAQLEKELQAEKMRTLAYSTLIDTAEEELGISLRKKSGAKQ